MTRVLIAYSSEAAVDDAARLFPEAETFVLSVRVTLNDLLNGQPLGSFARLNTIAVDPGGEEEAAARLATRGAKRATQAGLQSRGEARQAEGAVWRTVLATAQELDQAGRQRAAS